MLSGSMRMMSLNERVTKARGLLRGDCTSEDADARTGHDGSRCAPEGSGVRGLHPVRPIKAGASPALRDRPVCLRGDADARSSDGASISIQSRTGAGGVCGALCV